MKTNSDILTIKAVLLYILERIPDTKRSVYFVVKTAFYAQRNHLAQWGTPLLEDDICALPFGPVPSTTYDILKGVRGKELQDTRLIDAAKSIYLSNEDFFPTESADMDYLSKSAIDCINQALAEISQKSFAEILDNSYYYYANLHKLNQNNSKDFNYKYILSIILEEKKGKAKAIPFFISSY